MCGDCVCDCGSGRRMRGRGKWRNKSKDNGSDLIKGRFATHKGLYAALDEMASRQAWHPRLLLTKNATSTLLGMIGAGPAADGTYARAHAGRT